jgi:hypothetical protein
MTDVDDGNKGAKDYDSSVAIRKSIAANKLHSLLDDPATDEVSESDLAEALSESMFSSELDELKSIGGSGEELPETENVTQEISKMLPVKPTDIQPDIASGADLAPKTEVLPDLVKESGAVAPEMVGQAPAEGEDVFADIEIIKGENGTIFKLPEKGVSNNDSEKKPLDLILSKNGKDAEEPLSYQPIKPKYWSFKRKISAGIASLLLFGAVGGYFAYDRHNAAKSSKPAVESLSNSEYVRLQNKLHSELGDYGSIDINALRKDLADLGYIGKINGLDSSLAQIKNTQVELAGLEKGLPAAEKSASPKEEPLIHIVKKGNNLFNLVKQYFPNLATDTERVDKIKEVVKLNLDKYPSIGKDRTGDKIPGDHIEIGVRLNFGNLIVEDKSAIEYLRTLKSDISKKKADLTDQAKSLERLISNYTGRTSQNSAKPAAYVAPQTSQNAAQAKSTTLPDVSGEKVTPAYNKSKTAQKSSASSAYAANKKAAPAKNTTLPSVSEEKVTPAYNISKTIEKSDASAVFSAVQQKEAPEEKIFDLYNLIEDKNRNLGLLKYDLESAKKQKSTAGDISEYITETEKEISLLREYLRDLISPMLEDKNRNLGLLKYDLESAKSQNSSPNNASEEIADIEKYISELNSSRNGLQKIVDSLGVPQQRDEFKTSIDAMITEDTTYLDMANRDLKLLKRNADVEYLKNLKSEKQKDLDGLVHKSIEQKKETLADHEDFLKSSAFEDIDSVVYIEQEVSHVKDLIKGLEKIHEAYGLDAMHKTGSLQKNSKGTIETTPDKQPDKASYNLLNGKTGMELRYFKASETDDILSVMTSLFPIYAEFLGNSAGKV